MDPDRWKKIGKIYQAALEEPEEKQSAFLSQACGEDQALRREIEEMLEARREAGSFLGQPAAEEMGLVQKRFPKGDLTGQLLGHYRIAEKLGAGGMGEVYRARDIHLDRHVAIKVLPEAFTEDLGRLSRFEREAKLLASLNHPNVAVIHELEEFEGRHFLVLELVEGKTLAERIKKEALPMKEALEVCRQIAEGVEAAHEKGVVHRDLKPANIKITPEGNVKILDFGLAKAYQEEDSAPDLSRSPTLTEEMTAPGMILGTAAYMSPEQATGKPVDKRTDIWALGCLLFECLTGRQAFKGETVSETLAAVLKSEPDWEALPIDVPPGIRKLICRCLVKERRDRLQAVGDARIEIEECLVTPALGTGEEAAGQKPVLTARRREQLAWVLALVFLAAAIISAVSYLHLSRSPTPAIISEIQPTDYPKFTFSGMPVLSPDGRSLAYLAAGALWVRRLDSTSARRLPGTEGADYPFWSPDSRALGYFKDAKVMTIETSGGRGSVVADLLSSLIGWGGSWNQEGTILFCRGWGGVLYKVSASGGKPVPVLEPDRHKHSFQAWPYFLPDGKHFLYVGGRTLEPASSELCIASLDGKQNQILLKGVSNAVYASGFLLYVRDTTLMAQAFDPVQGQLKGDAHPVAEGVAEGFNRGSFDASPNGLLIYQKVGVPAKRQLTWHDRSGKEMGVIGETGGCWDLRLSPDGSRLAFNAGDPKSDLWVEELSRDVRIRLTNDPDASYGCAIWSPDGSRVLYEVARGNARYGIYQRASNGAGSEELLLPAETSDPQIRATSWSGDGRYVLLDRGDVFTRHTDIRVLPLTGDHNPRILVQTQVGAYDGQFSPNGRWVAYTSQESGREEVYIVPFEAHKAMNAAPGSIVSPGGKWQVSPQGGSAPRWRRDGKEIFYLAPGGQMMAAQVEERGNSIEVQGAQLLFRANVFEVFSPYDVTPDGERFVINTISEGMAMPVTLVTNWTALLGGKP